MSEATKTSRRIGKMRLIDATQYRLPLAGLVSILHRASGLLMFLLLPFVLYLLDQSLQSDMTFETMKLFCGNLCVKLVLLALTWAYLHHFCAGIRHLIMDFHFGLSKESGKQSAMIVFLVSLSLTGLIALKIFGVM